MNNMMASAYFDDQWLGMEAYKEWFLHGEIVPVQNANCVLLPETKLNCLTWWKGN